MVIIVHSRKLEMLPPLISLIHAIKDLGEKVIYIGAEKSSAGQKALQELNIPFRYYPYPLALFREHPVINVCQKLAKRIRPYVIRHWFWRQIDDISNGQNDVVIIGAEMLSAALLGDRALKYGKRYVQMLYELGDEMGRGLIGFDIERFYKETTLIECEYNRAQIIKAEHGIPHLPFVLPNKPYSHPRKRCVDVTDKAAARIVGTWKGRRVFLYQGALQSDRGELFNMIAGLCESRPNDIIAVMGRPNATVEALARKYPNFSLVPFVRPPHHLEVTSHADVGLAYYQGGALWGLSPLNAVYCAPNKIFEYTGYGIPMLCNDIPGLKYTVGDANAAICLEKFDVASVSDAANRLFANYDLYAQNATHFFESVDTVSIVRDFLKFSRS